MTNPPYRPSDLGSNDLEEDYPCNLRIGNGVRNITHAYSPEHQLCTAREGYSVQSGFINPQVSTNEDIAPQPHPYEGYRYEHKRLETFNDWPTNAAVNKNDLARNGFIYLHIKDRVQCVFCRGILSSWEQGDVIEVEHKKHCPECPFAFGYECGNIPLNNQRNGPINISVYRQSPTQFQNPQIRHPQNLSQHGNFGYAPPQANPRSNFQQMHPSPSGSPNLTIKSNSGPHQHPQTQRTVQTIQVRPESNANISINRQSGSLNIYSGNVTISAGNQEDAIGSMPSLPSPARPAAQTSNRDGIVTSPKYPRWENEQIRLKSFEGWPAQISQKPRDLAKAGLIYMGNGDRVKCFWCGGELHDWEPQDEPMEEHAKWFTICGYVRKVMGDDYIQKVRDKQNGLIDNLPKVPDNDVPHTPDDMFSHPHVLAVLQHGYTREQIQSAFDRYGKDKLYNAQKLMKAIDSNKPQTFGQQQSSNMLPSPEILGANNTQNSSVFGTNPTQAWTQSSTMEEGPSLHVTPKAMNEGPSLDISPQWLGEKTKDLYSPGSDEGIVIDDVEMEDMEGKPDQLITPTEGTTAADLDEKENKGKSETSKPATETKQLSDTKVKGKKEIDPVQLENEKLKDQKLCKICMDKELAITFLPCGHLATCEECSKSLGECPICRKPITQTVKVFWS